MEFINITTVTSVLALFVAAMVATQGKMRLGAVIGGIAGFALIGSIFQTSTQTALFSAASGLVIKFMNSLISGGVGGA